MTVNPGLRRAAVPPSQIEKVRRLRAMIGDRPIHIEVDGGVTPRDRAAGGRGRGGRAGRRIGGLQGRLGGRPGALWRQHPRHPRGGGAGGCGFLSRWRALIFDVDGTLAETEVVHLAAFNAAFAAAGLRLALVGGGLRAAADDDRRQGADRALRSASGGWRSRRSWRSRRCTATRPVRFAVLVEDGAVALRRGSPSSWQRHGRGGVRLAVATTTTPDKSRRCAAARSARRPPRSSR